MTIRTHTKDSELRQQSLFHEDINEALKGLVSALGGAKAVGARLFPDLSVDGARTRLLDSLNPDRAQQLSQTQFLTLLKWGREAGYHGVMEYIAEEAGYTRPSPRSPEEERADLQREVIEAVARLEIKLSKLGKLQK
jgi:hypothetical protein